MGPRPARQDRRTIRRGGTPPNRYQMRQKLISIGQDSYIEDASGQKAFHVDGKVLRVRDTLVFEDMQGKQLARIQERLLRIKDTMEIQGNILDHEYKIKAGRKKVAEVSKRWFHIRDTYGLEIEPEQNDIIILAITVAIDMMR